MNYRRDKKDAEVEVLRLRITEMLCRGMTERQIAEATGKAPSTVHWHIGVLLRRWRKGQATNTGRWLGRVLASLDIAEAEAWEAWAKSRTVPKRIVTMRARGVGRRRRIDRPVRVEGELVDISRKVELIESAGDAQFLGVILKCVEKRARLLGLYNNAEEQQQSGAQSPPPADAYDRARRKLVEAVMRHADG